MAGRAFTYLLSATAAALCLAVVLVVADTQLANEEVKMDVMPRRAFSTSDSACAAEIAACAADDSCVTCHDVADSHINGCGFVGLIPCDEIQDRFCCVLEKEDEGCESDTKFLDLVECLVEDAGNLSDCQAYDIDFDECNGAAGGDISRDVRFVVSSAAVAGIFLTALGFGE